MVRPILREEPRILYQDPYYLGVYKPANMPTQKDSSGDYSLFQWVKEMLRVKRGENEYPFVGLLHRLDRPVPGVLLFATTKEAASRFGLALKRREVRKVYYAVVKGIPERREWVLRDYLRWGRDKKEKEAILKYRVLASQGGLSLLEVELVTGRHHQIRIQLSKIGHPVVNDWRHGSFLIPNRCIGLLCKEIEFIHFFRDEPLILTSPVPRAFPWQGTPLNP